MKIWAFVFFFQVISALDVYLVRHGARSPLVVPMKDVFGVQLQQLTIGGKIESYYYGKELRNRHRNVLAQQLMILSTPYSRTRTTAEYFLKGWFGIHKRGNISFVSDSKFLPPSNISINPKTKRYEVDQQQYEHLIKQIPFVKDKSNRTYHKYKVSYKKQLRILQKRVEQGKQLCQKFQKHIPGSCPTQQFNQFFNFVDVLNCLAHINKTVPNVTRSEMQLPLDIINHNYRMLFQARSYPNRGVQQDLSLIQQLYQKVPHNLVVMFTHDTQLFYILRSLIGIQKVFQMFGGNLVMNFLSCLHFNLQNGMAKIYFNDIQFKIDKCGNNCTVKKLFQVFNS